MNLKSENLPRMRRKEIWDVGQNHRGPGGRESPGVECRGGAPVGDLEAEVPQKLKNF